jgi:hypothetical protein
MKPALDQKFRKYYHKGSYRGFHVEKERTRKFSRTTVLTFTNGDKTIHSSGMFAEEALAKGFKAIDSYHARLKRSKYDLQLA